MMQYYPEGQLIDTPKNRCALRNATCIHEACTTGQILEARALVCDAAHNLIVDLGCMKGVIPREEGAIGIREGTTRDIALISRVGKPVCFVVTRLYCDEQGNPAALLSRRRAQEQCSRDYLSALCPGDIIPARVTHLESFGAFCDIGAGNIALTPIDAISVSRIAHPRDRFTPGDNIRAIVKSVDAQGRISLSHKELLGTWKENARLFEQGQTVSGLIRSVEDYGIFVELTPNMAGLAESHPDAVPGQQASVFIKSLIPEKMKVKLIIISAFEAEKTPAALRYFYQGDTIRHWRYSPDCCDKTIESQF